MSGATSSMFSRFDDHSQHITLKIWSKTGSTFEDIFSIDETTFADVKDSAIRHLLTNHDNLSDDRCSSFSTATKNRSNTSDIPSKDPDNYKLISIESKRTVDELKTLGEERAKDGGEYLLTTKLSSKVEEISEPYPIDEELIELRTQDLPKSSNLFNRNYRSTDRTEFSIDLSRILITLIETSQKLLWCHPDAENIFKQAEEILLKPSTNSNDTEAHPSEISKLVDMGFTNRQAQIALKRARYNLHAAMELLLSEPDIDDDDDEEETKELNITTPLFSPNGPFISFRKFQQQRFQPNPTALQSLKEIGFSHDDIIAALRIFNNNRNLACEYLLGDRKQQQSMMDADNEQGLDPNSSIFQAIMQNATVQRSLNNPKTFFVMLQLSVNPGSITNYLNDPGIGNMLLQVSRIYHAEKYNMNTQTNN